jgi:hypothetical protein
MQQLETDCSHEKHGSGRPCQMHWHRQLYARLLKARHTEPLEALAAGTADSLENDPYLQKRLQAEKESYEYKFIRMGSERERLPDLFKRMLDDAAWKRFDASPFPAWSDSRGRFQALAIAHALFRAVTHADPSAREILFDAALQALERPILIEALPWLPSVND